MISRLFSVFYGIFVVAQIDFKSLRINSGFLIFPLLHSRKAKHTTGAASNPEKRRKTNDENEGRSPTGAENRVQLLQLGQGDLPVVRLSMSAAVVPDEDQLHLFSGSRAA